MTMGPASVLAWTSSFVQTGFLRQASEPSSGGVKSAPSSAGIKSTSSAVPVPDDEEIGRFYQYAVDLKPGITAANSCIASMRAEGEGTTPSTVASWRSRSEGDLMRSRSLGDLMAKTPSMSSRRSGCAMSNDSRRGGRSKTLTATRLPSKDTHISDTSVHKDYFLTEDRLVDLANYLGVQDIGQAEVARLYADIPRDESGKVGLQQFSSAVKEGPGALLLQLLVHKLKKGFAYGFKTPDTYDFTRPTSENYRVEDLKFTEEFEHLRTVIDYTYHNNYSLERQRWQDEVIRSTIVRSAEQAAPWLVFTCGPMGVGKGYCMNWMSSQGYFPLENIVHVDPDAFKMMMPEWPTYVRQSGENAGSLCHMESSLMMEIAQWAAIERRQNVWVDGSLRDADFYARVFEDIRVRHPHYKISIVYVYADEAVIRQRIRTRAERTGRNVPEALIQASLRAMDKALNMLTPLCDFVARIDNSGEVPRLAAFATIDTTGSWAVLEDRLSRARGRGDEGEREASLGAHACACAQTLLGWLLGQRRRRSESEAAIEACAAVNV